VTASTGQGWGISAGGFADLSAQADDPVHTTDTGHDTKEQTHQEQQLPPSPSGFVVSRSPPKAPDSETSEDKRQTHRQTITGSDKLPPVSVVGGIVWGTRGSPEISDRKTGGGGVMLSPHTGSEFGAKAERMTTTQSTVETCQRARNRPNGPTCQNSPKRPRNRP